MLSRKNVIIFYSLLALITSIAVLFYIYTHPPLAKIVHYHAGFKIYVDGNLKDFSSQNYMHIEPCKNEEKRTSKHEQLEKAHLHDNVGYVVHVHRDNAYWKDLFQNLRYSIPEGKSLEVFVNGKRTEDIFNKKIMAYDSVVFLFGSHEKPEKYLKHAITKQQIVKEEKKKESCGIE